MLRGNACCWVQTVGRVAVPWLNALINEKQHHDCADASNV